MDRRSVSARAATGVRNGVASALAALLAWWPPHILLLQQGFWAAITAIAVLQFDLDAVRGTARDQVTGAMIGGLVSVGTVLAIGQHPVGFALAVIVAITCCWLVNVASAARLAAITAAIILLVPHQGSAEHMMLSRVGEVAWGVTVAIVFARIATTLWPDR